MLRLNWYPKGIALFIGALSLHGCSKSSDSTSAPFDAAADCYAPQKTLSQNERLAFIKKISDYAQEAEITYGVPAAALTAMAAVEGGYGQTKTALGSNNLLGWKFVNTSVSEGRGYYVLECQPAWDENNKYVKFSSHKEAVMFVGQKLSAASRYKPTTDAYVKARSYSSAVLDAVNNWVGGISDAGYNYNPAKYKETIRKMNNNYVSPSWDLHPSYNTYKYSAAVKPFVGKTSDVPADDPIPAPAPTPTGATLAMIAPQNGATVSGDVQVSVQTPEGTTSVKFFSATAGSTATPYEITTQTSAPFQINWTTSGWVNNGKYDISAVAYKGNQVVGNAKVTVTVKN